MALRFYVLYIFVVGFNALCFCDTGVDLIDGTPVFDVKPYVPEYDAVPDARVPDWMLPSFPTHNTISWTP